MILNFDVLKYIPFVPSDHSNINDHRLYIYDTTKTSLKVMRELMKNPDNEIELYHVLSDGNIQREDPIKLKISEVKPAWTSVRKVADRTEYIIFE